MTQRVASLASHAAVVPTVTPERASIGLLVVQDPPCLCSFATSFGSPCRPNFGIRNLLTRNPQSSQQQQSNSGYTGSCLNTVVGLPSSTMSLARHLASARPARTLLSAAAGPSTSKSPVARSLTTIAAAPSCTCASSRSRTGRAVVSSIVLSPSARSLHASSRLRYPAQASATEAAAANASNLPALTETDSTRLRRIRNVGISAHIDS